MSGPRISLADWQAGGGYRQVLGQRLFVRQGGDPQAPTLLLIHGFPSASWDWEALWPDLARRFHLLTLDLLGYGFSAKPWPHDYRIGEQADLCEALLTDLGVERYHLLAHDYGDTVAQEILARQSEPGTRPRLLSACLLNGGLFPEMHRARLMQKLLLTPLGPLLARLSSRRSLAGSLRAVFGAATPPPPWQVDGLWQLLCEGDGRRVLPGLIRYIPERRQQRARWVGALQTGKLPLKLIDGAVDPISGAHMAERYRELVPQPDITLLPSIGHYPQTEAPAQVLAAFLAFHDKQA